MSLDPVDSAAEAIRRQRRDIDLLLRQRSVVPVILRETLAELVAVSGRPGWKATVWGDSNPANNGDYEWNGSGWTATVNYAQKLSNSTQTISNITNTQVALNGSRILKGNTLDPNHSPTSIGVTQAGQYKVFGSVYWNSVVSGGYRQLALGKYNSSNVLEVAAASVVIQSTVGGATQNTTRIFDAVAGDYFALLAYQTSGTALNINGSTEGQASASLIVEKV